MWTLLDTGVASAEENMRCDRELLATLDEQQYPILHLYDWHAPSVTYGYLTRPEEYLDLEKSGEHGLHLTRRPTGGGIVFHLWDVAFSLLVPAHSDFFSTNTLTNYAFVHDVVRKVVCRFAEGRIDPYRLQEDLLPLDSYCRRFCMAQPTKYDLLWKERKLVGAAQRQTKQGFLHQGTISLCKPDFSLLQQIVLPNREVLKAMSCYTAFLLAEEAGEEEYRAARNRIKYLLLEEFGNL
jgi:lipoate-protein ligase A